MTSPEGRTDALRRATDAVAEADLERMLLHPEEMPSELAGFVVAREGELDNGTMAEHGFPGQTEESIREAGRVGGYLREISRELEEEPEGGLIVSAGMVAHLFNDGASVERWIDETFLTEFVGNAGRVLDNGHELLHAEEVPVSGFHGKAAGVFAVHDVPVGVIGSTIVDFALGRLLGVAFVVALGGREHLSTARELGLRMERRFVSVALGGD
ncbi:MAG: hypothetical protein OXL97_11150 [Chloroflexota bacterium]|nr:hypothetical protein [Chloroflexota bacterium]MDE2884943.1 hypothetical protein [Chloroflexota bacterium]